VSVFVAVIVRVAVKIRAATRLSRKTLGPVLVVAIVRALLLSFGLSVRRGTPDSDVLAGTDWALAMTLPALAVGFLVGLARWWLFVDASLRRLVGRLHAPMTPDGLRIALAEAFEDPSLTVSYPLPGGGWLDLSGGPSVAPERRAGRGVTDIRDGGRLVAVLTHDPALEHEQAFVDAASSFARPALEIQRLGASVTMARHELDEAQARMAGVADRERRRIEHDLHDGVQQRLVALSIRLELAAEQIDADPAGARTLIRHLGTEVDIALRDVSSLGREAGPPLLGRLGLRAALGAAARAAPIPTTLSAAPPHRYPPAVESAAYFSALEVLRNAAQRGGDATAVHISLREHDDALWLEVSDDGVAGAADGPDSADDGLAEFRRRIAAVGGSSDVRSSPGGGTTVTARLPLAGG
jgi:signal transduction histidine kinase